MCALAPLRGHFSKSAVTATSFRLLPSVHPSSFESSEERGAMSDGKSEDDCPISPQSETMAVPLSWKACVKSFLLRFSRGFQAERLFSAWAKRNVSSLSSWQSLIFLSCSPSFPAAAASNIMISAKKTLKSSFFPSSLPYSKSREQAVPRRSHTLHVVVCSSPDNDEKRRLFPAVLLSVQVCCCTLHVPLLRPTAARSPRLLYSGRARSERSTWELILHYSQRASDVWIGLNSQIVWGKRSFSHEIL